MKSHTIILKTLSEQIIIIIFAFLVKTKNVAFEQN